MLVGFVRFYNCGLSHMVSFNIISLFSNMSQDLVIDIALQKIYSNKQMTLFMDSQKLNLKSY